MCLRVTTVSASSDLTPGGHAVYSIRVWFAGGASAPEPRDETATVAISAVPSSLSPHFTGCRLHAQQTCHRLSSTSYALTGIASGQPAGLLAKVALPRHSAGKHVTVKVTATSPQSPSPGSASDTIVIRSGTARPAAAAGANPTLPPLPAGVYPPYSLPRLPSALQNPGSTFPTLSPSSPTSVALPPARPAHLTNASATVPLDMPLVGGQVAGLALLAAAVTIAVARLTLRKPTPARSGEPPDAT